MEVEYLQREMQKGLDSGPSAPWNKEEFLKEKLENVLGLIKFKITWRKRYS